MAVNKVRASASGAVTDALLFAGLSVGGSAAACVVHGLHQFDALVVIAILFAVEGALFLSLRGFHLATPLLRGAAFALAIHPPAAELLVKYVPPYYGEAWWVYILTLPAAILGGGILVAYDRFIRRKHLSARFPIGFGIVFAPIVLEMAIVRFG